MAPISWELDLTYYPAPNANTAESNGSHLSQEIQYKTEIDVPRETILATD